MSVFLHGQSSYLPPVLSPRKRSSTKQSEWSVRNENWVSFLFLFKLSMAFYLLKNKTEGHNMANKTLWSDSFLSMSLISLFSILFNSLILQDCLKWSSIVKKKVFVQFFVFVILFGQIEIETLLPVSSSCYLNFKDEFSVVYLSVLSYAWYLAPGQFSYHLMSLISCFSVTTTLLFLVPDT